MAFFIGVFLHQPMLRSRVKANIRTAMEGHGTPSVLRPRNFSLPEFVDGLLWLPFSHAKAHRTQQDTQIGCQAFQGHRHRQDHAHARRPPALAPMQVVEAQTQTRQVRAGARIGRRAHKGQSAVRIGKADPPDCFEILEAYGTGETADQDKPTASSTEPRTKKAGDMTCHVQPIRRRAALVASE